MFAHAHRRNAHLIARGDARVGLGALAVDAHLAGAQDAVDQAFRHPLELPAKEIVDALAIAIFGDLNHAHAGAGPGFEIWSCKIHRSSRNRWKKCRLVATLERYNAS